VLKLLSGQLYLLDLLPLGNAFPAAAALFYACSTMIKLFSVKVMIQPGGSAEEHVHASSFKQPSAAVLQHPTRAAVAVPPPVAVQDKQKKDAAAAGAGKPKQSAGELRLNKGTDISMQSLHNSSGPQHPCSLFCRACCAAP
jgi:hypothetical protein